MKRRQAPLYRRVLGARWDALSPVVCRFHDVGDGLEATGVFRVRCGPHRLAPLVSRLLALPRPGDRVPVRLTVTAANDAEVWSRELGRWRLVTVLRAAADPQVLLERRGLVEFRLPLTVAGGALEHRQESVAIRLGPLRIPLPRSITPFVAGREEAAGEPGRVHVEVTIGVPRLGTIVAYAGDIAVDESRP